MLKTFRDPNSTSKYKITVKNKRLLNLNDNDDYAECVMSPFDSCTTFEELKKRFACITSNEEEIMLEKNAEELLDRSMPVLNPEIRSTRTHILFTCSQISNPLPYDDSVPIYSIPLNEGKFYHSDTTKGEFCRTYLDMCVNCGMNEKAQTEMYNFILDKVVPKVNNLPQKLLPTSSSGNENGTAKSYVNFKDISITFDCCEKGDHVYSRNDHRKECPNCATKRYFHCSRSPCSSLHYLECQCHVQYRVPQSVISYRPVTGFITRLLNTPDFFDAISFKNLDEHEDYINECLGTPMVKRHMEEMKTNAKAHLEAMKTNADEKLQDFDPEKKIISINLVAGVFYDSAMIHKHSSAMHNFSGFTFSLLNLPPNFRKQYGRGTFLPFLFTGLPQSDVEDFMLDHCFTQEMKMLDEGITIEAKGKTYFVQCRIIMHWYDTKALEKMLKFQQMAGSYIACQLCGLSKGEKRGGAFKIDCLWTSSFFTSFEALLKI
jgi:hypothetical protein